MSLLHYCLAVDPSVLTMAVLICQEGMKTWKMFCLSSPNQSKLRVKPVSQGSDLSSRYSALKDRDKQDKKC